MCVTEYTTIVGKYEISINTEPELCLPVKTRAIGYYVVGGIGLKT